MHRAWLHWLRFYWPVVVGFLATVTIWFLVPVPYIVYEPGPSVSTRAMVETVRETEEEGAFLLTTVRWTYANVFSYAAAKLSNDAEIVEKEVITRGATRSQYKQRQGLLMRGSHSNAVEAVYRKLGIPYEIRSEQIVVFGIIQGLSADGRLLPGDQLLEVDGVGIEQGDDLRQSIDGKQSGDVVEVKYRRKGEEDTAELELRTLPNSDPPRPGLGITYGIIQKVESVDPAYEVNVTPGSIGGPSAGLMFALQIYNQFTEEDWTRGYTIAGTGEISPDGMVGTIGGVTHKVVGAHRKEAELFFVPLNNAKAAKAKAAAIGTKMKIVPVGSLQEAIDYLAALPSKETRTGGK
jgi:PDZ domain-containing protein